ncbi:hypothetical protein [Flavobacterium sp. Root186]|uniref:hypothetical protein n=1 Tax=Flavobacterium sp. Root186 TaxID=1736485 RepID=UPI0006F54FC0|nr:hypothetical protein [Flavobacterium sp. Root186]KRB56939.1 hypothetical protein ASD98_09685 [Flavobacterium sp. Root186]
MEEQYIIPGSIILVSFLTLLIFLGIWFFGKLLYKRYSIEDLYLRELLKSLDYSLANNRNDWNRLLNTLSNYLGDLLEKRNNFWNSYGQMAICIFIIGIIAILLLTKTITPEAGLPILSAVSGFAIANKNGANNNKTNDNFPNG